MRNYGLTPELVLRAVPEGELEHISQCLPELFKALDKFELTSRTSLIAAIATIGIECPSFEPQIEWGDRAYFEKTYGDDLGPYDDGIRPRYSGKGLIQLTHEYNYRDTGKRIGINLVDHPDKALDLPVACLVLADYFAENGVYLAAANHDWYNCRKLVNGNGHDRLSDFTAIANYLDRKLSL